MGWWWSVVVGCLAGCAGQPCTVETCDCDRELVEPVSTEAASYLPTDLERDVLTPVIEDIRAGIRAFDEHSVGVCRGTHGCDDFLGADAGMLPPGQYLLQAVLRVPDVGPAETWTVHLTTECHTITWSADGTQSTDVEISERDLSVQYAGVSRGFPLRPLAVMRSPLTDAAVQCTWTLSSTHPGTPTSWSGSWGVPRG